MFPVESLNSRIRTLNYTSADDREVPDSVNHWLADGNVIQSGPILNHRSTVGTDDY